MADRSPTAGGGIIALTTIAGAVLGGMRNQGSAGLIAGLILGCAIALALWLRERHRIGR